MNSRRRFLSTAFTAMAVQAAIGQNVDSNHGRVRPPLSLPDFPVTVADGSKSTLHRLLGDQAVAIQLMFTECRTTCPMEGAIFEKVQSLLPNQFERRVRLLSVSVSPNGEKPGALSEWLQRYHAGEGWTAAVPEPGDRNRLAQLFGTGRSANDPHSTQVQIVDRHRQLIWRTGELPSAAEVAGILMRL